METINPQDLIATASAIPLPAAPWFLLLFKVIGFTLHAVPMGLMFAGTLIALLMHIGGGEHARRWSTRMLRQMPIIVAFGINLGIVPLLFTQVAYSRVFYPATILMANQWIMIIALLIFAYYGVYIMAAGLKEGRERLTGKRMLAGLVAALLFIAIGLIFSSAMRMMADVGSWPQHWANTEFAGAVTGMAVNHGDPAVTARWLMAFGLSIMTVAAWIIFDAGFLGQRESEQYRLWARGFAMRLFVVGAVWFAATGSWYTFGTWSPAIRSEMFGFPLIPLTLITAISPALVFALLLIRPGAVTRSTAMIVIHAQVVVVALNAVSRQVKQSLELAPFMRVSDEPVNWQLSPLLIFLVLFVAGVGFIGYLVKRAATEAREIEAA